MATAPAPLTPAARRILDAAATLFYERGITAVGVDLIAKEAGVTKKTLYDRFGSKEALVAAYLHARDQRWRDWMTGWLDSHANTPQERVIATFDALAAWLRGENPRGCAFVNAAAELPDPAHPGRQVVTDQKRWLHSLLHDLCAHAGATEPARLADELALLHEGATVLAGLEAQDNAVARARTLAAHLLTEATRDATGDATGHTAG